MSQLEELRRLVEEACGHPPGSPQRQRLLTQIIRLVAGKLWKENSSYYQDGLQQTWLYFCRNICEGYDPDRGTVITWLNVYLKHRLQDLYLKIQEDQIRKAPSNVLQLSSGDKSEIYDPIENIAAPPDTPPILENVKLWAKCDKSGDLRQTHIQGRPDVNCQVLILKRLPPEVSWRELASEYGLTVSTLSSFYQRQCIPKLRQFAQDEGYL
ncbi:MAG: sigma-70 family RNA polymerase sigma factor [Calothrix sp. C42_A2020_038]|nr:sigma-70 family RNA polymerase sigma factor [Calothrix sp. C42_A2020_038]